MFLRFFKIILTVLVTTQLGLAQLTIGTTQTPAQLVNNVLVGGGIVVSNVTFNGGSASILTNQAASFNATNCPTLSIKNGIMLATGDAAAAIGPNNSTGTTLGGANSGAGDPDLAKIAAATTRDKAVLEFDFIPSGDSISFRYVFASEEYLEFVGSYNDAFGFFLSGPGISGTFSNASVNLAIIPGSSSPVTINNVNNMSNAAYYYNNGNGQMGSPQYTNNSVLQYDGQTVTLIAKAKVQCGKTYHIKIAIADAGDTSVDSGVFLEAGSFSSNILSVKPTMKFGTNDSTIYEGCGAATLTLKRNSSNLAQSDTVRFTVSGQATLGADYTLSSPNMAGFSVGFPAGSDSVVIELSTIQDLLAEGTEQLTISFNVVQCGILTSKDVRIYMNDVLPVKLNLSNDTILYCANKSITLKATASGGITSGNYKYSWSAAGAINTTGRGASTLNINPQTSKKYYVTVKDTCGLEDVKDSINVTVIYTPPTLKTSNDTSLCIGDSTVLNAKLTLGLPGYKYKWLPANISGSSINIKPNNRTIYTVTATDSCGIELTQTIIVNVIKTRADFATETITNNDWSFINTSAEANNYIWDFGDSTSLSTDVNPYHTYEDTGRYNVTLIVKNNKGCVDTLQRYILVKPGLYFYFPNSFTPNGDGNNDVFAPKGLGIAKYNMNIFNRWGELIYNSNDINQGWDGSTNKAKSQTETYTCVFDVEDDRGNKYQKIGSIILIR